MAKKATGSASSKKAPRKAEQRRRARRKLIIYAIILVVCVGILALIPRLNRGSEPDDISRVDVAVPTGEVEALTVTEGDFGVEGDDLVAVLPTATPTPVPTPEPTPTPSPTPEPQPITITITAAGDCTFGGCLKHDTLKVFKKYVDNYGYDYFFDKVRNIFQADDLTVINLEGPLTDVGTMTTKSGICFCGDPAWTGIMTGSSIELCNMANNHSMDMGAEGMQRTAKALDEAGIGYCGYTQVYHTKIKGIRITALGFDKWNNTKEEIVEAVKRERPDCELLIVNMHWGFEMKYDPMDWQKEVGRAIIDAGGDLVIGTHPHVFGGVVQYKGKYICYSLGNFCFGGHTNPADKRAMIFQQNFVISPNGEVSDGGINVIPVMVSGTDKTNDFQPYVLGADAGTALLKKIAKYSNLNKDTLWMKNSYPEQIGLIQPAAAQTPEPEPEASDPVMFQTDEAPEDGQPEVEPEETASAEPEPQEEETEPKEMDEETRLRQLYLEQMEEH